MTKHNEYLLVEVPEGEHGYFIHNGYLYADERYKHVWYRKLPPGTYQLIGRAAELTEEQKKGICIPVRRPSEPVYYKLYNEPEDEQGDTPVATTDVNRAFISLLRSRNLKPETTLVIKEIKK